MSDCEEVFSNEETHISGTQAVDDERKGYIPSQNVTIEDSETEGDSDDSEILQTRRNLGGRRAARIVSDSEDDEPIENRALSPRTRMSMTGIRPADLLSDSSEIEYDDEAASNSNSESSTSNCATKIARKKRTPRAAQIVFDSEEEDDELIEERALSPRTRMSITGVRPPDLGDDTSDIEYSDQSKLNKISEEYESAAGSMDKVEANTYIDDSASVAASVQSSSGESYDSAKESVANENVLVSEAAVKGTDSPCAPRYTNFFEKAIKEQLSSTVHAVQLENSTDDSELQVVSNSEEKTIEISSTDSEKDLTAKVQPRNAPPVVVATQNMVQPKISTAVAAQMNRIRASVTDKKPVSRVFYNMECKKLDDLKVELFNTEKLLNKIAHNLPDGGRQLTLRVENLRKHVQTKTLYLATLKIEDEDAAPPPSTQNKYKKTPDWEELSAAVHQVQPIHTGKQGLATFDNQKALTVERLKDIHGSLETCPSEDVLDDDPNGLKVSLMVHQRHALAWMRWRESQRPHGGILADDMGLGKTLTTIAMVLAAKNREENGEGVNGKESESESEDDETKANHGWSSKGRRNYYPGGTLVICPASLLSQWEAEVDSKVKSHKLSVCVHHGYNRETKAKYLRKYDFVVTTYQIVAREHKTQCALFGIKWKRIVLDEAHVVRNHKSQCSVAVCGLRAKNRWVLTGTPIQNKEMDMYALLKFLRCSPFDDLAHWKRWVDKSAGGQQRLNTMMKSLMLRRTKVQLQERGQLQSLPAKKVELIEVQLDKDEMNVYQKVMIYSRTLFAQFLFQRAERNTDLMYRADANLPTFMQTKDPNNVYYKMHQKFTQLHNQGRDVKSHEILVLLLRLRQICCHPGLIDAMLEDDDASHVLSDGDTSQPEIDLLKQLEKLTIKDTSNRSGEALRPEEEEIARASAKVLQRSNPVFDLKRPSSKMLMVLETIKKSVLKAGDKAVVVSQWTSVLNILKNHLEASGIATLSLNGCVPVKNRQDIIAEFNKPTSSTRILLLSLTAGGVGLNLVGGNHLLMIDLHWNPQLEAQAQDRIYRVGQQKDVVIYKFLCKDTVEERIKALQEQKLAIADTILTGAKATAGSKLTIEDLKSLFGL